MKMRRTVIICASLLILLLGSGCAAKHDQIVYVPQKCKVTLSSTPVVEQCDDKDLLEWGQCAYRNYVKMKEYNEVIKAEAKVCE